MGRYINRTPKRHILGWKDVIMTYRSWCVRPVHMMKKPKKTERNLTVAYWVFGIHLASDHPRRLIEIQFVPENSGQMVTLHSSLTYTLSLSRWDRVWKSYNQKKTIPWPQSECNTHWALLTNYYWLVWIILSYLLGCTRMYPHEIHASLPSQIVSQSVW